MARLHARLRLRQDCAQASAGNSLGGSPVVRNLFGTSTPRAAQDNGSFRCAAACSPVLGTRCTEAAHVCIHTARPALPEHLMGICAPARVSAHLHAAAGPAACMATTLQLLPGASTGLLVSQEALLQAGHHQRLADQPAQPARGSPHPPRAPTCGPLHALPQLWRAPGHIPPLHQHRCDAGPSCSTVLNSPAHSSGSLAAVCLASCGKGTRQDAACCWAQPPQPRLAHGAAC